MRLLSRLLSVRLHAASARLSCGSWTAGQGRAMPMLRACALRPCLLPRAAVARSFVPSTAALALPAARPRTAFALRAAPRLRFWASAGAVPDSGAAAAPHGAQAGQPAPAETAAAASSDVGAYKLVTFYRFTPLEDPHAEVARHKAFCEARDIKGRIYVNEQGINAQLSGYGGDAVAYADWVTSDPRFAGTRVSVYDAPSHSFPRLTLRYKANLVQLEGGTQHLDLSTPEARAHALSPQQWREKLQERAAGSGPPFLLDVRNGYEWDTGRFEGAERPVTESFRETVEAYSAPGGPLADAPRDAQIMMYCTGGIRCDVYSAVLKEQGFTNMFTLQGGVQAYLDEYGSDRWEGHLFVFDSRLAMTSDKRPSGMAGEAAAAGSLKCHCCSVPRAVAPHRNCPNVDCNRLFLVCPACLQKHGGFCCDTCAAATHVRPVLLRPGQHYERWSHYADGDKTGLNSERRGEGRRLRRQRRKERHRQEEHEWAVAAVAAALKGEAPPAAAEVATDDAGTARRRSRAARLANTLGGPGGWAGAQAAQEGAEESWGITGDSRFSQMRKALREEAAARLAAPSTLTTATAQ